jgi:hypothetical protein
MTSPPLEAGCHEAALINKSLDWRYITRSGCWVSHRCVRHDTTATDEDTKFLDKHCAEKQSELRGVSAAAADDPISQAIDLDFPA